MMVERLSLIVNEALVRLATRDFSIKREEGQGVTEYGIALGFVAVVVAGLLVGLSGKLTTFFNTVGTDLSNLPNSL
jgi:Flp pilus assembly pilin Flp